MTGYQSKLKRTEIDDNAKENDITNKIEERKDVRQTRSYFRGIQNNNHKPNTSGGLVFDKEFEDVRIGANKNRNHLFSKLVLRLKIEVLKEDVEIANWRDLEIMWPNLIQGGTMKIIDNITLITGEFNFRGFMKNYLKDILNHYRIKIGNPLSLRCRLGSRRYESEDNGSSIRADRGFLQSIQ